MTKSKKISVPNVPAPSSPTLPSNQKPHSAFIESLNLQDAVKLVETLKTLLFNAPDVDQTKINFFKNELLTGKYEIDSHHIAHQLLEHVQIVAQPEMA
jgi:negative regulator of flagellin synthesis FlgM